MVRGKSLLSLTGLGVTLAVGWTLGLGFAQSRAPGLPWLSSLQAAPQAAQGNLSPAYAGLSPQPSALYSRFASGPSQLLHLRSLVEDGLVHPSVTEELGAALLRCLRAQEQVTWCSFGALDGQFVAAYREPGGRTLLTLRRREGSRCLKRDYEVDRYGERRLLTEEWIDYDPRERPWWKVGIESEEPTLTAPFLFASRNQPGVALTLRQRDDQMRLQGVWLLEYELGGLSQSMRSAERRLNLSDPQHRHRVFLANQAGTLLADSTGVCSSLDAGCAKKGIVPGRRLLLTSEYLDPLVRGAFASYRAGRTSFRQQDTEVELASFAMKEAPIEDWRLFLLRY